MKKVILMLVLVFALNVPSSVAVNTTSLKKESCFDYATRAVEAEMDAYNKWYDYETYREILKDYESFCEASRFFGIEVLDPIFL